jgi:hypothetical protein
MSSPKTCQLCGRPFFPDCDWKKICLPCFKEKRAKENEFSELAELRNENYRLRAQLRDVAHYALTARSNYGAIPLNILSSLIRLCHPDRHNGSETANTVTAWLLSQRGQA